LSRKSVPLWAQKFSEGRSKVADDARPGEEVIETTVERLLYSTGFDALVKRWDKCINVGREINVFPRFEYHTFYVVYPFVTYLLTLLRSTFQRTPRSSPHVIFLSDFQSKFFYVNVYIKNIRTGNYVSRDQKHNAHVSVSYDVSASDTLFSFCARA
jgi:hypothetical protein